MKKNLKKFDGFDFDADSNEYKKRLEAAEKVDVKKLAQTAGILELDSKGSKEELAERIFKFLQKPDGDEELPEEEAEDEEEPEEEEASEEEPKKPTKRAAPSSGKGRETSKGGRPKRSTAGRGYQDYTSSEEDERVSKPKGRRRNDSDSGSDYNPSGGSDSDAGKRRSVRAPVRGSRASVRARRKQSSEEEESESPSDDDFSDDVATQQDEPKKKKAAKPSPRGRGRPSPAARAPARGRGRKRKAETESEDEEEESEAESEDSEKPQKKSPVVKGKVAETSKTKNATPGKRESKGKPPKRAAPTKKSKRDESTDEDEEEEEPELDENESEDEKPLKKGKEAKEEKESKEEKEPDPAAPPSEDDIKEFLKEILEEANLEEITMKTVCKKVYAKYPDHDLSHKKDFIKATVKSLIST